MSELASTLVGLLVKTGIFMLVVNEIRGFVLAAPVLYAMYASGGEAMAMWVGFCSLAGIALSVVAPLFALKKLKLLAAR